MNISSGCLNLIKQAEGYRDTSYDDGTGTWTIGYGHTRGVKKGMKITQAQADVFLLQDVAGAVAAVNKLVKVQINQNQFDALVSFEFNTGDLATSDLLKYLNAKNFAAAANEFPKFDHAAGKVLPGLLTRRNAEKALFLKAVEHPAPVAKSAPKHAPKPAAPQPVYHVVGKGDVVSTLAKKYGSTIQLIKTWNGLDNSFSIKLGQKLRVK